jgi:hypothetical protein
VLEVVVLMVGALTVILGTGVVALDGFSLAAPAWSGCLRIPSRVIHFHAGISTLSNWTCFFFSGLVYARGPV